MARYWRAVAAGIIVLSAGGTLQWRHSSSESSPPATAINKDIDPISGATPQFQRSSGNVAPAPATGIWARPTPSLAAQNARRCGVGAALALMGANPDIIERLSNGDINGAFSQLRAQATAGDVSAANQLDYIANLVCGFAAINGSQSEHQTSELRDINSLPSTDGAWLRAVMESRNAYKQQLLGSCQQSLDKREISAWVTAAAANGDPASEYSLWMFGGTNIRRLGDAHLRAAALGGYPWAQFSLGSRTTVQDNPSVIVGGQASDNPGDLLRLAAQTIPDAEGQLSKCEFGGCEYIAPDITAAVADARSAAEQGSFDAILTIGPQLQASEIDPDEVQAWRLINAALQIQGYEGNNIDVRTMRSATAVLNSPAVTPNARFLADQYWQNFSARILLGLGCTG